MLMFLGYYIFKLKLYYEKKKTLYRFNPQLDKHFDMLERQAVSR